MSHMPVLIIDDERAILESLQVFLEDEGYDIHLSAEGAEAIDIFKKIRPELVVTDLRMPGMSGIEIIRRIREMNQNTAIIVITGYGSLQSAVDAIRLDVFDFLSKPIDLDLFKATLDRARDKVESARRIRLEVNSMQEKLQTAQHHLDRYEQRMADEESLAIAGRLLSGVLHNLKSPLTSIRGEAQMLQMVHPEMENLDRIEQQACRMAQIIESVLGKVRQSQVRLEEWLDLNRLLEQEVIFLESHPYFKHEIQKSWVLDRGIPPIMGIAADFGQVFGNILRNAAEAMKGSEIRELSIRTWRDKAGISIAFRDSGPGIPHEIQSLIFKPFFSTKREDEGISGGYGMGLGLYSSRSIIEHYGGSIEVISSPGEGTTFIIHLPDPS